MLYKNKLKQLAKHILDGEVLNAENNELDFVKYLKSQFEQEGPEDNDEKMKRWKLKE